MKPNKIVSQAVAIKYPPMFRAVTSAKRRKRLLLHNHYGTSSKPATSNFSAPKFNISNMLKNTVDSLLPAFWKSVTVASSMFNNVSSRFTKENTEVNKKVDSVSSQLQKLNMHSSNALFSDNSDKLEITVPKQEKLNENSDLEQGFLEWLAGGNLKAKRIEFLEKDDKNFEKSKKMVISKSSLQHRSRFLVTSLSEATSAGSQLLRLEEACKHLLLYPEQKTIMCKAGLVRTALRLKYYSSDQAVQAQAKCALSLIGIHDPPRGQGIRILSIDGGGTRGIMAIEVLRQLEVITKRKVHELFDFMCGVSSGAILSLLLGGLKLSLDECESLYRKLSDEVFKQSSFWGTGRLMWSHAYYDTTTWVNILKKTFGEKLLIDTSKDESSPKLAAVSAVMNLPQLQAFIFRNYDYPPRIQSHYFGSCRYRMWEAIRASGAAPGYFEEYCLDDYLHQDGGIMINNTAALSIHEARLLWPSEHIQCVLSLGSGRYIPAVLPNFTSTSLKTKVLKVIDSATDTEGVHIILNDLLTPDTYFRINPYLTEFLTLDENRPEKLDQMKTDAQMYLRRNEYKFENAARKLSVPRSYYKRTNDWIEVQKNLYL